MGMIGYVLEPTQGNKLKTALTYADQNALQREFPIGLEGCGIWVFFAVIFGI